MSTLRGTWRALVATLHMLHGFTIVMLQFERLDDAARQAYIGWWSRKMFRLIGVALDVEGRVPTGAVLIASNHVSWMDILAIHAACPQARFVSKADVLKWPLLGRMIGSSGTLFIERERKRDALRVVHQMTEALQSGQVVAVFPEGTTGDGISLLPFHANLLQAAISAQVPIQPVALRFSQPGHRSSPAVAYVGSTTLAQSIWRVVCADAITVHVNLLAPLPTDRLDRRQLSAQLSDRIAARFAA